MQDSGSQAGCLAPSGIYSRYQEKAGRIICILESEVNEEISVGISGTVRKAESTSTAASDASGFFMGYEFYVDERVLVPRQDTEVLGGSEELHQLRNMEKLRILDMCTGSGCILLSLSSWNCHRH